MTSGVEERLIKLGGVIAVDKEPYGIGLDIGTSSIGWSVVDMNGRIKRVKGQTGLGVRLFEEGQAAAERRGYRTTRRRLSRRRWRLRLLREIFDEPISAIDASFFARQKASNVSPKDTKLVTTYRLFSDQSDGEFYEKYPTIYHLRQALMTEHRQFDLREIYLAIHHIVKYRGNFLRSGNPQKFQPGKLDFNERFTRINQAWLGVFDELAPQLPEEDLEDVTAIILDTTRSRLDRQRDLVKQLMKMTGNQKSWKPVLTAFCKAILGLKAQVYLVLGLDVAKEDQKSLTFSLADIEDHRDDLAALMDEKQTALLEKLVDLQAAIQLTEIMPDGKGFSESMVQSYVNHKEHLCWLKKYATAQTDEQRRTKVLLAYDHYIDGNDKGKAETTGDFYNELRRLLKGDTSELAQKMMNAIELEKFMPKQRTKGNGVIPYQVHQQELDAIIENQKDYYPFLAAPNPVVEDRREQPYKLDELVHFRVPYYVGPMITAEEQAKTAAGQFAWMVRKEPGDITVWNFDKKVDRVASATNFIARMKTTDTYLIGEDVLPLQSLIYQRFMVLNELNGIRVNGERLRRDQKQRLYNQVFKTRRTVSIKAIQENLVNHGDVDKRPVIEGLADPKNFNSSLSTYQDLKAILSTAVDDPKRQVDIEKIVNWSTVFEDQRIFKDKLQEIGWLTDTQRNRLSAKRYRGWGRLSARLLTEIQDAQGQSIMDQLWQTQHTFMQIVHEPDYAAAITAINAAGFKDQTLETTIDELYTSPQNKKALRQIVAVVRDIQAARHGQVPSRIFIEAARGAMDNPQRTRRRQKQLTDLFADRAKEIVSQTVTEELKDQIAGKAKFTDRLLLYFLQNGRDMYTGEKLNIDRLSQYDIDHILPQSLIKDDSLDNRVLVQQRINRDKNDSFAADLYASKMQGTWELWRSAGLVSARKLRHLLMRADEINKYATGFVNRQLVETRQVIKLTTDVLSSLYDPEKTQLISVKAALSHQLRTELKLPKLRELNDYHHALDAYLAARIGTYLLKRYPKLERFFVYGQYKVAPQLDLRRFNFIHDLVSDKQVINPDTGELLWDREADIKYLEHLNGLKHLLVTHEVFEDHGALFDQTIYPARKAQNKKLIPTKQGRDTAIYGGYSGQNTAYLAIVKVHDKVDYLKVMAVPIRVVSEVNQQRKLGLAAEKAYLKKLFLPQFTKKSGTIDFEVVRPHVYLQQRIEDEVYGEVHQFALRSSTYYRNLQQLWLPLSSQQVLLKKDAKDGELTRVFDQICEQAQRYFSLYERNNFRQALQNSRSQFVALPTTNVIDDHGKLVQVGKREIISRLMRGLHANAERKDLKVIGIKTSFGLLQEGNGIRLGLAAKMIMESPTGLFKREVRIDPES